jgi:hypothetical protein
LLPKSAAELEAGDDDDAADDGFWGAALADVNKAPSAIRQ